MARAYKRRNKSIQMRSGNGRFRKATGADFGIDVCQNEGCRSLTRRVYDGPEDDPMPDPRLFRQRCFTCEPKTEAELEAERARKEALAGQKSGLVKMLEDAAMAVNQAHPANKKL